MKNWEALKAASIDDHSPGLADRLASSRNTRTARKRYHGLAKRCSPLCSAGASRPSTAWL
jgi:hypothetical protein